MSTTSKVLEMEAGGLGERLKRKGQGEGVSRKGFRGKGRTSKWSDEKDGKEEVVLVVIHTNTHLAFLCNSAKCVKIEFPHFLILQCTNKTEPFTYPIAHHQ